MIARKFSPAILFCVAILTSFGSALSQVANPSQTPRVVNVTADSAPGWIPSVELENQATATLKSYLKAKDSGLSADAYSYMADVDKKNMPFGQYKSQNEQFLSKSGSIVERRIVKVTWTKDPAQAPFPGVYAAIDLASRFARVDRHCGFIVLYQAPSGGPFQVMREESNFIYNENATAIANKQSQAELDRIWAQLSANCPQLLHSPIETIAAT